MTVEQEIKAMIERCDQHRTGIALRLSDGNKQFVSIAGRIEALELWQQRQNGALQRMDEKLGEMLAALHGLQIEMATGRPSWAILALITTLFSLSVGLGVYVVTHL
jgi:hypothetical protein